MYIHYINDTYKNNRLYKMNTYKILTTRIAETQINKAYDKATLLFNNVMVYTSNVSFIAKYCYYNFIDELSLYSSIYPAYFTSYTLKHLCNLAKELLTNNISVNECIFFTNDTGLLHYNFLKKQTQIITNKLLYFDDEQINYYHTQLF